MVKRVKKLSPFYKYDGKTFFHIRKDEEWKIIPKLEDRRDIIEKAHVLGHFQVDTTFDRLREKYYWKNMKKNIETEISKCTECLRNQKVKIWSHPAIAMKVKQIGDIITAEKIKDNGRSLIYDEERGRVFRKGQKGQQINLAELKPIVLSHYGL